MEQPFQAVVMPDWKEMFLPRPLEVFEGSLVADVDYLERAD